MAFVSGTFTITSSHSSLYRLLQVTDPGHHHPLLSIIVLEHVVQGKLCTGEVIYIQGAIKNIQ
jgi:hypothetical protein